MTSVREVLFDLSATYEAAASDLAVSARIDRFIARAQNGVSDAVDWARRDEAVALLALHYLEARAIDAEGTGDQRRGRVTAEQTDNARTTYAHGSGPHGSTEWGARFDELMDACPAVGPWALGDD